MVSCKDIVLTSSGHSIERFESPLPEELIVELASLWRAAFKDGYQLEPGLLSGEENEDNLDIYYLVRYAKKIVATAHCTIPRNHARLGGLGEVVTIPEYRGRGLAQKLCRHSIDEFEAAGGEAFFLGTGNPVAARVYGRAGWKFLSNSNVMLRVTGGCDPQEYIKNYFRKGANLPTEIVEGGPGQRVGMIPLIVQPHEWVALDANAGLFSTRVRRQTSCMGLYPQYEKIEKAGKWFAAQRSDGATVGLASAKQLVQDCFQVDAFTQLPQHLRTTAKLYKRSMEAAAVMGAKEVQAVCADQDELKRSILKELDFEATDQEVQVETVERPVELRVYRLG